MKAPKNHTSVGKIIHPPAQCKDEVFVTYVSGIRATMPQSPHMADDPQLQLRLDRLTAATDKLGVTSAALKQNGAERKTTESDLGRLSLGMRTELRGFVSFLRCLYAGNPKALESFGLERVQPAAALVTQIPQNLRAVSKKRQSGHYSTHWRGGKGAGVFELQMSPFPAEEATFVTVYTGQAPSFAMSGAPGTTVCLRVRGRGDVVTPYCAVITYVIR